MSEPKNDIKKQRDRFLAFSFATADLLLEIDQSHQIHSCLGATKNLLGEAEKNLLGTPWHDIIEIQDLDTIKDRIESAAMGQRIGPLLATLKHQQQEVLVNAIKMPKSDVYYITFGLTNGLNLSAPAGEEPENIEEEELLTKTEFNQSVQEKLEKAKEDGIDTSLTFLDLDVTRDYKKRLGKKGWEDLSHSIAKQLNESSLDGQAAGQLSESRYTLLHETSQDISAIKAKILSMTTDFDPEKKGLTVEDKTIQANTADMSSKEASRAILYTLNEFERNGVNMSAETLSEGFDSHLKANTEKIGELKNFIANNSFDLYFQPIVRLADESLCHYETLSRFSYGNTQDWIMFCEDIGMAPEFDLAVCMRVIQYIENRPEYSAFKFAINISGQSIGNEQFFDSLYALLLTHPGIEKNISFEITESYHIDNLHEVSEALAKIKDLGFKIALDDFGAGAASFEYLLDLNVDYVKIDGKYIKNIVTSEKDQTIVKNIANMCADLKIEVIAEYVEDEEIIQILKDFGITYGQGYHYSKPRPQPDYEPKKQAA